MNENPLIEKYENKSVSTRLKGPALEYFLKFAARTRAKSISDAFQKMIDEMQSYLDLTEDEIPTDLFNIQARAVNDMFLGKKEKETITLEDIMTKANNIEFIKVTDRTEDENKTKIKIDMTVPPEPRPEPEPEPEPIPEPEEEPEVNEPEPEPEQNDDDEEVMTI